MYLNVRYVQVPDQGDHSIHWEVVISFYVLRKPGGWWPGCLTTERPDSKAYGSEMEAVISSRKKSPGGQCPLPQVFGANNHGWMLLHIHNSPYTSPGRLRMVFRCLALSCRSWVTAAPTHKGPWKTQGPEARCRTSPGASGGLPLPWNPQAFRWSKPAGHSVNSLVLFGIPRSWMMK